MIDDAKQLMDALEPWLSDLFATPTRTAGIRRATAGQSSGTLLFDALFANGAAARPLVLRVQPGAGHLFPDADVIREGRILRGLASVPGVAVPEVLGQDAEGSVLGSPFFVMEQIPGRVPQGKPSIHVTGWLPDLTARALQDLWEAAMATLAAVHAAPWTETHGFLGDGVDHLSRRVGWLDSFYRWAARGRTYPVTDAAMRYLIDCQSEITVGDPVLVWGDARVGNMIFSDDLAVAAAIDWELATIGAPEIDLAHWLFFDEFSTSASGIAPLKGWPNRDETVGRYQEITGRALHDLDYFDIMQELFMATTLIRQSDNRVAAGLAHADTRMGHDNTVTQMLARSLGLPVPELSPDYSAHRSTTVKRPDQEA